MRKFREDEKPSFSLPFSRRYYNEVDVLGVAGRFLVLPLLEVCAWHPRTHTHIHTNLSLSPFPSLLLLRQMSLRIAAMEERLCVRPNDLFTSFTPLLW